jgi:DNA repair exonuclease SbcCD ATPase subunit
MLQQMDDFLGEAGGRLARHAASEKKRIRAALSELAGVWRCRLSDCESQVDRLTAFLSQESHWNAVEESLAENRNVLCAYETWQRDLSRARADLEQTEFNAASERLARDAAALSTAERARDLKETADRNGAVLAYREFAEAVQRRSELSAAAQQIYGKLSVLRERKKLKQAREDRIELLGERRAELEERRTAIKSLTACLFGTGEDNGVKRWLYDTHVVPFLESEINDFVGQIDDFSISVSLKNADDLCFSIRDRGACPSIDHASGFQRFVLSMGMRIALGRMGAGTPVKHFFIDEGFTACDANNMRLVRPILDAIMTQGGFRSVLIISHLEAVKEVAVLCVQVERDTHQRDMEGNIWATKGPDLSELVRVLSYVIGLTTRSPP